MLENSAKNWATGYDFPARRARQGDPGGRFPTRRRERCRLSSRTCDATKFQDIRVRLALNYAWDFESIKKTIFFGQYKRIDSYFAGTELASSGSAGGQGAGNPGNACATRSRRRSSPPPYSNPVGGDAGEGARQPPQGAEALQGGRIRAARPATRQLENRRALRRSSSSTTTRTSSATCCPISRTSRKIGIDTDGADRRQLATCRPHPQPRLRHDRARLGSVAVARQRAARHVGQRSRRPAELGKLCRASRIRPSTS